MRSAQTLRPGSIQEEVILAADQHRRKRNWSLAAGAIAVVVISAYELNQWRLGDEQITHVADEPILEISEVKSVFEEHRKTDPNYPLPGFIAEQLPTGSYHRVREGLINLAAEAVESGDRLELANQLALLGAAALSENDLASARVYLDEALDVYEEQSDSIGIGSAELLRGRVETVARENARDASSAHEVMQIAAWMIVRDRFAESEVSIKSAVDENLRLNRYGAAAAGYEMLERGYRSVDDVLAAQDAAKEALRLHAASGRVAKAEEALFLLEQEGLAAQDVEELKRSITLAERDYENSVFEIRRAKDYEQLYRRLINAGDPVQAWMFRQKANESLALASKRAMHRRQTGIVALLFNSNDNRQAARNSLVRAREIFAAESRDDLVEHINSAEQQVW